MTPQQIAANIAAEYRLNPKRWTQGGLARNKFGVVVDTYDPTAVCFCLRGEIEVRLPFDHTAQQDVFKLFETVLDPTTNYRLLKTLKFVGWQDAPERTVEEVIDFLDKAAQTV